MRRKVFARTVDEQLECVASTTYYSFVEDIGLSICLMQEANKFIEKLKPWIDMNCPSLYGQHKKAPM